MNRFDNKGLITEPCGEPFVRSSSRPSSCCEPELSTNVLHKVESTGHRCDDRKARMTRSQRRLSKKPLISRSITQLRTPTTLARHADRIQCRLAGRYPYESAWKCGSTSGSSISFTTICAMRSETVGMPSGRVCPVVPFGISTRRTGGGKVAA